MEKDWIKVEIGNYRIEVFKEQYDEVYKKLSEICKDKKERKMIRFHNGRNIKKYFNKIKKAYIKGLTLQDVDADMDDIVEELVVQKFLNESSMHLN